MVPGSPMVAEHTVELLLADPRVRVIVEPAMSFVDLTWVRLGIDPVTHGVRIVDGHRFATDPPTFDTPMLIGQCHAVSVLSDVKLALDLEAIDEIPVATVVHHLGLPSERIAVVAWPDLDRLSTVVGIEPDHLTSLYVPALALGAGPVIRRLEDQMRALRARCPWDREQTHASLAKYAIEEAAELVEAISFLDAASMPNGEDPVEALEEELGDVLFQVLFHACVAAEEGWFDLTDVARTLFTKMERRHPHVFGGPDGLGAVSYPDAASVKADWEAIKAAERAAKAADRLPRLT